MKQVIKTGKGLQKIKYPVKIHSKINLDSLLKLCKI